MEHRHAYIAALRCSRTALSVRLSLARERVMRAGEPLLPAIPAAHGAQHAPFGVDPFGGIYIRVCMRIPTRAHVSLVCTYVHGMVHASARTHTRAFAPANTYCRIHHHRVLYNAAIDSRPLFHARDLLQSLQPVSGDSLQCPVSLPVSVHKIYFPRRYTGCRRENRTRAPAARKSGRIRAPDTTARIMIVGRFQDGGLSGSTI